MKITHLFFLCFICFSSFSQETDRRFERAVNQGNFSVLERKIKRKIHQYRTGERIPIQNSYYIVHGKNLLEICRWIEAQKGVLDVQTDGCSMKISIFPGWTDIGVRYKTAKDTVDVVYHIQEGKALRRPLKSLIFRKAYERNKLIYKNAYRDSNFVDYHRFLCHELQEENKATTIDFEAVSGIWKNKADSTEAITLVKDSLGSIKLNGLGPVIHFAYPKGDRSFLGYGTAQSFVPQFVILDYDADKKELRVSIQQFKSETKIYIFRR